MGASQFCGPQVVGKRFPSTHVSLFSHIREASHLTASAVGGGETGCADGVGGGEDGDGEGETRCADGVGGGDDGGGVGAVSFSKVEGGPVVGGGVGAICSSADDTSTEPFSCVQGLVDRSQFFGPHVVGYQNPSTQVSAIPHTNEGSQSAVADAGTGILLG